MISFSTQSSVSHGIHKVIHDFFINQSESFDFVLYGRKSENLLQLVNDVIKLKSDDVYSYQLIRPKEGNETLRIVRSAILMFDTLHSYYEFHARAILGNEFPRTFNFLVSIDNFDDKILENFLFPHSIEIFRSSSFLTQNSASKKIKLSTFVAFEQPICRTFNVVHINWFSRKWKTEDYFIEKFKNFNQCWLLVELDFQNIPYAEVIFNNNLQVIDVRGPMIHIHWLISRVMNFSIFYNFRDVETKKVIDSNILTDYRLNIEPVRKPESNATALIQPIITREFFIVASRSPAYSNFEKVFLPFELEVWVCLIFTMTVGVVAILLLKLTTKRVQNYVFGSKVTTPLLNFM